MGKKYKFTKGKPNFSTEVIVDYDELKALRTDLARVKAERDRLRELVNEYIYLWEHEEHHLSGIWYGLYIAATKALEGEDRDE